MNESDLAVMANNIEHIKDSILEIKGAIKFVKGEYVTKTEFRPVKNIVYGLVGAILISVIGAILVLVIY